MKNGIMVFIFASVLALGACAQDGSQQPWGMGTKQTVGTAGGAVLGGLAGSAVGSGSGQLWATGAGALIGAFVGSSIGKSLDRADMRYHEGAVQQAYSAPLNETINWNNPQSGHSGSVTPVREGRNANSGGLCRQYRQTIVVDGQAETAYGTACQNADGSWSLAN
jgi:surface antigen